MNPRTIDTQGTQGKTPVADQLIFGDLNEPGTYVCNSTGHLFRVPEDAVKVGRSPAIEILSREPLVVSKLSDNPFLTINKARMIAADLDLAVNF